MANRHRTSLYVVLLSLFKFFLSIITGQKDILAGLPLFGRDHVALQNIVGFFITTGILNTHVPEDKSFVKFIEEIHFDFMELLQNQSYPIELVLDELNMKFPVIPVFFNLLNFGSEQEKEGLDSLEPCHLDDVTDVKFDLMLYVTEYRNGIQVDCRYKKALFLPGTIASIMEKYSHLIRFFTLNPEASLLEYKNANRSENKRRLVRKK